MAGSNRRFTLAAVALPLLFVVMSGLARANTILVNTTDGDTDPFPLCTLPDAIQAANTHFLPVNGCAAGSGDDTILFNVTGTINIDETLIVTDPILSIVGPEIGGIKINGGGSVQIFHATVGTTLSLSDLTLENGFAAPGNIGGGAVFANGTELDIDHSLLVNNQAGSANDPPFGTIGGKGGAIYGSVGKIVIVNSTLANNTAITGSFTPSQGGAIFFA